MYLGWEFHLLRSIFCQNILINTWIFRNKTAPCFIGMDYRCGLHLLQLGQSQLWETPGLFQPAAPSPPLSDSQIAFNARSKGPWLSVCLCTHICIDHICSCWQSPRADVFHQASHLAPRVATWPSRVWALSSSPSHLSLLSYFSSVCLWSRVEWAGTFIALLRRYWCTVPREVSHAKWPWMGGR